MECRGGCLTQATVCYLGRDLILAVAACRGCGGMVVGSSAPWCCVCGRRRPVVVRRDRGGLAAGWSQQHGSGTWRDGGFWSDDEYQLKQISMEEILNSN